MLFETPNEFSIHIETIARDQKLSYTDAILKYCEDNYLEPDEVSALISKSLKEKVALEFQEKNYLPKTAQLDI